RRRRGPAGDREHRAGVEPVPGQERLLARAGADHRGDAGRLPAGPDPAHPYLGGDDRHTPPLPPPPAQPAAPPARPPSPRPCGPPYPPASSPAWPPISGSGPPGTSRTAPPWPRRAPPPPWSC